VTCLARRPSKPTLAKANDDDSSKPTVVGNIVNDPIRRTVGDQVALKFRVASSARRRTADGIRRSTLEMRASAMGPDLSRCIARVEKTVATGADAAAGATPEPGSATDASGVDGANRADGADAASEAAAGLTLSA
jgi:single-strand DNA-binding protein